MKERIKMSLIFHILQITKWHFIEIVEEENFQGVGDSKLNLGKMEFAFLKGREWERNQETVDFLCLRLSEEWGAGERAIRASNRILYENIVLKGTTRGARGK